MDNSLMKRKRYAMKIVREGLKSPFYRLISTETFAGVSTAFYLDQEKVTLYGVSGYYTIYRKNGDKMECLYVGKTDDSLHGRINRWAKGVAGKLRPDENHSAAKKARKDGVRLSDELYVKIITEKDIRRIVDDIDIRCEPLDEWIAPIVKSRYNYRTFNTGLETFFE